ncbi:MAG: hypothetical protein HND27_06650 [Bacteroidetes bacterium]|nr:hypothetical protein [Bacteroidota bacterium]MBV6460131.1 hypothetical protein [Flavobacteriales bacterium]WKZ74002.1 MAG: hypothetical protein QY303_07535 [Vicingaceae bacterium]MCL4816481.1 hypothetical protein [Flavobacteriales bacterium]NOG95444.1 hypothetical protein [Bacteroidota bacterium]
MQQRIAQRNLLLYISVFFIPAFLLGQETSIPINVSFFNESTAIPYTRFVILPIHPGIQVGTEWNYQEKEHSRLFQTANSCYFYHNYLAHGMGIYSELGYEYRLHSGLAVGGLLGLGYMHTLSTTEEFIFLNGQYVKKADKGNARIFPSLSADVGYYPKKSEKHSLKLFLRYQSWVEYPYSPDFIPLMTHINLHLGVKVFIKTKANE